MIQEGCGLALLDNGGYGGIRFDKPFGIIWGEFADKRSAAYGHLFLVKRIKASPSDLANQHQPRFFQAFEMMADCRLLDFAAKRVYQIIDA